MAAAPRVLIADDSVTVRAMLRPTFEQIGWAVLEVEDGVQAVDAIRQERPDVALIDLEMPQLHGSEVVRTAANHPETAHVPLIVLTASTDLEAVIALLEGGAHDFIAKSASREEIVARVVAALRVRRASDVLRQAALIDVGTGLYNRRHVHAQLQTLVEGARRRGEPLSVVLFDFDHFKDVNDRFGHLAGDVVLREAAGLLQQAFRAQDVFGRWGGEEFLAVLPGAEQDGAAEAARRALANVREARISTGGTQLVVTVSAGVAQWRSEDLEVLLQRADAALYTAKRNGRDRVDTHA